MRLSQSPAEHTADAAEAAEEVSGGPTRPRRTLTSATAARVTAERAYRTAMLRTTSTPDTQEPQGSSSGGGNERGGTPPLVETLAASRHADVQQPASSSSTAAASMSAAAASATAASATTPAASPAPGRARSGSTTQHRVYQPSSLFGANAAPLSLSSSFLGQEAPPAAAAAQTRRPVLSRLKERTSGSAADAAAAGASHDNDASEDTDASALTPPRQSTQTSVDVADVQDAAQATENINTVQQQQQQQQDLLTLLSSGSTNSSHSNTAAFVQRDVATAEASPVTVPVAASTRARKNVNEAPRTPPIDDAQDNERGTAGTAAGAPDMVSVVELQTPSAAAKKPVVMRLAKYAPSAVNPTPVTLTSGSAATAARRASAAGEHSTSRLNSTSSRDAQTQAPADAEEDKEEDDAMPFTMSSLVAHVAVPATVQAVLKNPAATKHELWVALRAACQQCALLQRRLARMSGQLTDEDEQNDAAMAAAAPAAAGSISCGPSPSRREMVTDESAREGHSGVSSARSLPLGTSGVLAQPGRRVSPLVGKSDTVASVSASTTGAPSTGEGTRCRREHVASITNTVPSTAAAAPPSPLSTSALMRGGPRTAGAASTTATLTQPHTTLPSPTVDAASVLRNRIAEEIRRVEATRRQSGNATPSAAAAAAAPSSAAARTGATLSSAYVGRRRGSQMADRHDGAAAAAAVAAAPASSIQQLISGSSTSYTSESAAGTNANVTVKVPDDAALGRRKVREAVVKSRDADAGPPRTSPPPLPTHESRLSSHHTPIGVDLRDGADMDDEDDAIGDDVHRDCRSGSVASATSLNGGNGGSIPAAVLRRHASTTSDTVSVRSGNNFTLPSIPSTSQDNMRRLSFMSRSHNSGRLVPPPRPPSSPASESVAASGGSPAPQSTYHRRVRNASVASGESVSGCRDGSISSAEVGNICSELHAAAGASAAGAYTKPVPPISCKALTASTTLPVLSREDATRGPLSARLAHQLTEDAVESLAGRHGSHRASVGGVGSGAGGAAQRGSLGVPQSSSWVSRPGSLASPLNAPLPALRPSPSSPLQRSLLLQPLQPPPPASLRGREGTASPHAASGVYGQASAAPSLLDMVRQVAQEETPVSPASDAKKAELREWRRQAAKAGMHGAPSAA